MRRALICSVVVVAAAVASLCTFSQGPRRWLAAAWAQDEKPGNNPAGKEEPEAAAPKPGDAGGNDVAEDLNQGRFEELTIPPLLDKRGKVKQELSEVNQRVSQLKSMVSAVTSGEQPLASNQPNFDNYFNSYLFPRMTWVANIESPESFNFLVEQRNLILNQYLKKPTLPAEVHDQLVRITLATMTKIATGNYHPAARHNAMLIIAELNTKEMVRVPVTPPEPHLPALTTMVDALGEPMQLDVVRVAAMVGILRHVQWDARQREKLAEQPAIKRIDDPLRDRINQLTLAIINAKVPPAGRTLDGHAWMQRRAIDILSVMGTISSDVNAAQTIEAMISNLEAPVSLRCTAAESLGQLNPAETKLDALDSARKLGELAVFLVRREVKRVEDEKKFYDDKRKAGGGGGLGGMGGFGGMPGAGMPGAGMPGAGAMGPAAPGGAGAGAGAPAAGMPGAAAGGDFAAGAGMSPPGMGGGMGMPGMGPPGMGMPGAAGKKVTEDYKRELVQRRLRSQMQSIKIGLVGTGDKVTGVMSLTSDDKQKAMVKKLVDEVVGLRDATDDDKFRDMDKLMEEVNRRLKLMENATKAFAAAKAPAAPAAANEQDGPDDGPPAAKPAAGKPAAGKPAAAKPAAEKPAAAKPAADPAEADEPAGKPAAGAAKP